MILIKKWPIPVGGCSGDGVLCGAGPGRGVREGGERFQRILQRAGENDASDRSRWLASHRRCWEMVAGNSTIIIYLIPTRWPIRSYRQNLIIRRYTILYAAVTSYVAYVETLPVLVRIPVESARLMRATDHSRQWSRRTRFTRFSRYLLRTTLASPPPKSDNWPYRAENDVTTWSAWNEYASKLSMSRVGMQHNIAQTPVQSEL